MGPDRPATKVNLDAVEFADGLSEDEGWIKMRVQFLISEANAGAQEVVFGRTIFPPGSRHDAHRHEHAEEIQYLQSGEGVVIDDEGEIPVVPGDVIHTAKGRWHGFRNTSETEDAVVIWLWAGAGSREKAGYEARSEHTHSHDAAHD
jgi:quercetin dioxygenase-like cupin family protein